MRAVWYLGQRPLDATGEHVVALGPRFLRLARGGGARSGQLLLQCGLHERLPEGSAALVGSDIEAPNMFANLVYSG